MKQGLTPQQLSTEINRQRTAKADFIADTHRLRVKPLEGHLSLVIDGQGEYGISYNAHNQLADRMAIPHRYYHRMREKAPDLLASNVNHWFDAEPDKRMVRTLDGEARAYLSTRYRPLDHHDLADAVLPAMLNSGANIHSCHLTPSKIYIKGVMEKVQKTIPPPSDIPNATPVIVSPGIVISNSETGEASLTIQPAIHFLRCTNLATWAQHSLRRRHVGQIQGDLDQDIQQFLSDRTKTLSDAALWSRVSDLTQAALNGDIFHTIVEELRVARLTTIRPGAATATVERLAEAKSLPDTERSGILEYLMQGGEFSKFGLSNAITRFSQDTDDYDRATYLEELGGEVIALNQRDWSAITV